MKKIGAILGTMAGFYFLCFWVLPGIYRFIFPWGGVAETHLHPLYMGMILLSGLIVVCTILIMESHEKQVTRKVKEQDREEGEP